MNATERRHDDRIVIPGVKVNYRLENGATGSSTLKNLTKTSACIQLTHKVLTGQPIEIDLIIPEEAVISVKAKIVWVLSRGGQEEGSTIGIQFKPFGAENKFNSLETEKHLEKIIEEYQ
jgi:Tfp pilus assembly protein PilZ